MKHFFTFLCFMVIFPLAVFAQTVINVPSDVAPGEGNLNDAITAHLGDLSNYIFMLEPYGYYVLSEDIQIPLNHQSRE